MVNTNPTVSEINLCLLRVVKLGIMKVKPNMRSRNLEETLTTSPAMNLYKRVTMRRTMRALQRKNLKKDIEAFRKMNQENLGTTPLMEEKKTLVNVKDASCSLMMVIPTEEWYCLPSHGLMFCQKLSQ